MVDNKLVINYDKTQLLVMGTKSTAARQGEVFIQAGEQEITPAKSARLLVGHISEDLKWRSYLLDSDQSVIKQLNSRVNGLLLISSRADFDTRLMVVNGIIVSKLCYLIHLRGGCEGYLLDSLQILMNKAARYVTGDRAFNSIRKLLYKCNWLSVKKQVFYQTVIMTHKTKLTQSPQYVWEKIYNSYPYRTRQSTSGCIRMEDTIMCSSTLTQKGFRFRGVTSSVERTGS